MVSLGLINQETFELLESKIATNPSITEQKLGENAPNLPPSQPISHKLGHNIPSAYLIFQDQNGTTYSGAFWESLILKVCHAYGKEPQQWRGGIIHFEPECFLVEISKGEDVVLQQKPILYSRTNLPISRYDKSNKNLQDVGTLQRVEYLLGKPILKVSEDTLKIDPKTGLPVVQFFTGLNSKVTTGQRSKATIYRETVKTKISTQVKNLAAKIPSQLVEIRNLNYKLIDAQGNESTLYRDGKITVSQSNSVIFTYPHQKTGADISVKLGYFYCTLGILGWDYGITIDTNQQGLVLNAKYLDLKIQNHLFNLSQASDTRAMSLFGASQTLHHSKKLGRKFTKRQVKRGKQSGKKFLLENYQYYRLHNERKQIKGIEGYVEYIYGKDQSKPIQDQLNHWEEKLGNAPIVFPFWLQNIIQKYLDVGHCDLEVRKLFNSICLSVWYAKEQYQTDTGTDYVGSKHGLSLSSQV